MKSSNDYIDIIKAFGKQDYIIYNNDYREYIKKNPLINGLWTVGRWFSFVANTHTWELEFIAGDSNDVIGYTHDEIIRAGGHFVANFTYPDDFDFVTEVIRAAMKYVSDLPKNERQHVYVVFYLRSVRKDGTVITVQNQNVPVVFDSNNIPFVFANVITDISHLQPTNIPHAILINQRSNQQYHLNQNNLQLKQRETLFTLRERDVIRLLIRGHSSRKIAEMLNISYETVRTHRKNILGKASAKSTGEFIHYVLMNKIV